MDDDWGHFNEDMLCDDDTTNGLGAADALGRGWFQRCTPYIYAPDEIVRLMQAASQLASAESIRPLTYRTLFGLLAATGMRISEALALRLEDLTDDGLVVRETKFQKSRLLPLHETTTSALHDYLSARLRVGTDDRALLVGNNGRAIPYDTAATTFLRLARAIGLRDAPGKPGPRIHDMRHTFAARSLEQCPLHRGAIARHLVALSTYLGHAHVTDTYWYLEATPILMKQIAKAGEAHLREVRHD